MRGKRIDRRFQTTIPRVLTVAGSDSGGGAGIQGDLKTIALLGGYGMSAITAVTAQNTRGIQGAIELPADFVAMQMESVITDIGVDALKTGMLASPAIVAAVAQKIRQHRIAKVVVDPVMAAKDGSFLLFPGAREILKKELLPQAHVITPNLLEGEILTGQKIRTWAEMKEAGRRLHRLGAKNVLIKGGHLAGDPVDVLFDGKKFRELPGRRVKTLHTHGTGCTLSAAIAVELAKGSSVLEAVEAAKKFITTAIQFSLPLGHGCGPVNAYAPVAQEIERYEITQKLKKAFQTLREKKVGHLFPEVQANLGYALPYARGVEEVAAFPGRLTRMGEEIGKVADPEFGVSQYTAKVILTVMAYQPEMRSAMNLRFSEEILTRARKAGFILGHFNRQKKTSGGKRLEDPSLCWGIRQVLKKSPKIPDMIFDRGDVGREPMIRLLGRDPEEVAAKVIRLLG